MVRARARVCSRSYRSSSGFSPCRLAHLGVRIAEPPASRPTRGADSRHDDDEIHKANNQTSGINNQSQ